MDILARIIKCVLTVMESADVLDGNMRLKEDIGLDSLSLAMVIVELEEEFVITFDDGDLDPAKIITIKDIEELVRKYV